MKLIFKIFLILTILYAAMIFYLSSISDLNIPREWFSGFRDFYHLLKHSDFIALFSPLYPLLRQQDKVLHIMLYFGFGVLLFMTLKSSNKPVLIAVVLAILIGILYSASDEFHQMFVPGRSASTMDVVADFTGLLFAQTVFIVFYVTRSLFFIIRRQLSLN